MKNRTPSNVFEHLILCLEEMKQDSAEQPISRDIWEAFLEDSETPAIAESTATEEVAPTPSITASPRPDPTLPDPETGTVEEQWAALETHVANCKLCPLAATRRNAVFGEGKRTAELMFIGEGPGEDEDKQGRPFVGRAGELLDKMINAMGYAREDVYIANVVKCRPPGNRVPETEEAERCIYYLMKQIQLIQPKVIVLLGLTAVRHAIRHEPVKGGITALVGQWLKVQDIPAMPIFHPSYLLRLQSNPEKERYEKQRVWSALQLVMRKLQE